MAEWLNGKNGGRMAGLLEWRPNGGMAAEWRNGGSMAEWLNGGNGYLNGGMVEWRNGQMARMAAEWWDCRNGGRMAEWRPNGGMVKWR